MTTTQQTKVHESYSASAEKLAKIKERLESLAALVEHPNTPEHERAVAASQMEALMAKYAITEAITAKDATNSRDIYSMDITFNNVHMRQRHTLLNQVSKALGCKYVMMGKDKDLIFGLLDNIQLAWSLYLSLEQQMDFNRTSGRIPTNTSSQKSYMVGFAVSLRQRLENHYAEELRQMDSEDRTRGELVLLDDQERINDKVADKVGPLRVQSRTQISDRRSYWQGEVDGSTADISHMGTRVGQQANNALTP